jgi:hypothetical protein
MNLLEIKRDQWLFLLGVAACALVIAALEVPV